MPRDRYHSYEDEWDDDEYEEVWDDSRHYDAQSQALINYRDELSQQLPIEYEEPQQVEAPMIIPGAGIPMHRSGPRRRRPITMQVLLLTIAGCVILSALFSVGPLADTASGNIAGTSPFNALANALVFKKKADFEYYRVRSGQTFDDIALAKGILLGGIYKANNFTADQEAIVGETIKLSTDPAYGKDYNPPLPPGVNPAGASSSEVNIALPTNSCVFCAVPGHTNGPGNLCAPTADTANNDALKMDFLNPENGLNAHWVRGFTPFHSGVDLSTGQEGTPLFAAQDGQVIFANYDSGGGGYTIKINHCGWFSTSYSHMVQGSFKFKLGDNVHKGDIIGLQGNTGNSFGAHIHYILWWHNIPIDPLCGYTSIADGYGINSFHSNGCPPNLGRQAWP